jgi:hypothetical protein
MDHQAKDSEHMYAFQRDELLRWQPIADSELTKSLASVLEPKTFFRARGFDATRVLI